MSKLYTYFAEVEESDLYACNTEDGTGLTFDCTVLASSGGKTYRHKSFYASGSGINPDGIPCVLRSRDEAQAFASRVNERGVIDLAYWEEVVEDKSAPSLEERWADEARRERQEAGR